MSCCQWRGGHGAGSLTDRLQFIVNIINRLKLRKTVSEKSLNVLYFKLLIFVANLAINLLFIFNPPLAIILQVSTGYI